MLFLNCVTSLWSMPVPSIGDGNQTALFGDDFYESIKGTLNLLEKLLSSNI